MKKSRKSKSVCVGKRERERERRSEKGVEFVCMQMFVWHQLSSLAFV